jgi:hypothetical protein
MARRQSQRPRLFKNETATKVSHEERWGRSR